MEKHFCTCPVMDCPIHPNNSENHNKRCDECIQKNLELGEVPACIWGNVKKGIESTSEWSMGNFSKFFLEKMESAQS